MRMVLVCSLSALVACGGDDNNNSGDDAAGSADGGPTELTGEKYTLTYPMETVEPDTETTKCVWMRLPNAAEVKVHIVHNMLSSSSHHLIVYKDDMDMTEQLTPVKCTPFAGALNPSGMIAPIVITQKQDDLLTLPDRVAYTFDPNQMIKLEMHYLNSTDEPIESTATVEFAIAKPETIDHEADILFIGSPDLKIPANQEFSLKQFFTVPDELDLSASKIFDITGHTHHLGTDMQVRVGASKAGPMTSVYAPVPFLWSEPETTRHSPEFNVPTGGGFEFECKYRNTTNMEVEFGESANDEMCFFWAYYYPSQGSKVCVHTQQVGGPSGLDICCPGSSLCALLDDQLNPQP